MTTRTAAGLGFCGAMLGAGIVLGAIGAVPAMVATALAALGFSLGSTLSVLSIVDAIRRGRRSPAPVHHSAEITALLDHAAALAEIARQRGFLALAGANVSVRGLAGWLLQDGCELVIRGEAPDAIRGTLNEALDDRIGTASKRRAIAALVVSGASVAVLLVAFVILVDSMGLALDPSRMSFGSTVGLMLCVYAAFGLAVIAPTVVDRLGAANERDELFGALAIEAVAAIREGQSGPAIRTLLEHVATSGADPNLQIGRPDALAA